MNAQQQAALEFYACPKNWERPKDWKTSAPLPSKIMVDGGSFARRALLKTEPVEPPPVPHAVIGDPEVVKLGCTCELCLSKLDSDHSPDPAPLQADYNGGPA